jgi:hypothetical protein
MSVPLDSPNPLASAVLAVLKVARDCDVSVTTTKLVMLLYLADLEAVQEGRTQFSGATWRCDETGPYDHAITRAEDWLVDSELVERSDSQGTELSPYVLAVTFDLEDPLDAADMDFVRNVVRLYGHSSPLGLRQLCLGTGPLIQARAGGDRGALLDLNRVRRNRQTLALLERYKTRRAARRPEEEDRGAAETLKAEFLETRDAVRRANTTILGDQ